MDRPIRILHLIPTLAMGGAELYVRRLARGHDRERFQPSVVAMQEGGPVQELLEQDGTPVDVLKIDRASVRRPLRALRDVRGLYRGLRAVARRQRVDLIQTHLPDADWLGLLVGWRLSLPVVVTCHSSRFLPEDRADGSRRGAARLALMRRLYPRAAALVPVGSDVRESLLALPGVRPERVRLIRSGIEYPEVVPDADGLAALRRRHAALLGPGPHLISAGRLVPGKGFHFVLEAFARIVAKHPDATLWIVGEGPERERLERERAERGLDGSVHLLGRSGDVQELLWLADAFLTGTRFEGLGLAAAEAMAARLPVAAFRVSGIIDVVEDGVTGLLVPDGDAAALGEATLRLLADPDRARRMGAAGRESARRFDVARSREASEALYADLLANS